MNLRLLIGLCALAPFALAHVGNPDVYYEGMAGPYRVSVTIRPPVVIPGVAELEVRSQNLPVRTLHAVPVPLAAERAKFSPVPDTLKQSGQDARFFTGSLWIMAAGSWQVRLTADGPAGPGAVSVPLPSVALATKTMQPALAVGLFGLMALLVLGLILITGASVRQAKLPPGELPGPSLLRRAQAAMAICAAIVVAVLFGGWGWWQSEERQYSQNIFSALHMRAQLSPAGLLHLTLSDPAALPKKPNAVVRPVFFSRTTDDLVLDHEYLMHLYALREPGLDVVFHLHPRITAQGEFALQLPRMDAGRYRLYADIVHANGFPETPTTEIDVPPGMPGRDLQGDDARGQTTPWPLADTHTDVFPLPDGFVMKWLRPGTDTSTPETFHARQLEQFRFVLLDRAGKAPRDMGLYLGMAGHAAFVKTDGSAFAHIHPSGTVAMASLMMAQSQLGSGAMSGMDHTAMAMDSAVDSIPNEVAFPYGFPSPGRYRIIVQMKHGHTVETGIFDAAVSR